MSSPCVIFLHTRGGGRVEGRFLLKYMLPKISVCLFDFAGSGKSEGDHITLGVKEKRDLDQLIDHLRKVYSVGKICLWGRSMGAVTALLYAKEKRNKISGIVLDSPFTHFYKMVGDVVRSQRKIPRCIITCFLCCLVSSAKKKTQVDLSKINPIKIAHEIDCPAFFLVMKKDILAKPERVKELFEKFKGSPKEFYLGEGTHQSVRDPKILEKGCRFVTMVINKDTLDSKLIPSTTSTSERSPININQISKNPKNSKKIEFQEIAETHGLLKRDEDLFYPEETVGDDINEDMFPNIDENIGHIQKPNIFEK